MAKKQTVVELPASPAKLYSAAKASLANDEAIGEAGTTMMAIGFGDSLLDAEFFAITISDARRLRDILTRELHQLG